MKSHIVETLTGLGICLLGFVLGFLNLVDITNASLFSSLIALCLIIVGTIVLFKAGRRDRHAVKLPPVSYDRNEKSLVDKHNEFAHHYAKTSQMRDKLKVIKHSGHD